MPTLVLLPVGLHKKRHVLTTSFDRSIDKSISQLLVNKFLSSYGLLNFLSSRTAIDSYGASPAVVKSL